MINRNKKLRTLWITILICFAVLAGGCGVAGTQSGSGSQLTSTEAFSTSEQTETNEALQEDEEVNASSSDLLSETSEEANALKRPADETSAIETTGAETEKSADETVPSETTSETRTEPEATTAKTETEATTAKTEPEQTTGTTADSAPEEPVAVLHIEARSAAAAGLAGVPEDGIILPETVMMIEADETVADLLIRAGREYKIAVAYQGSGSSTFITGIAGITAVNRESGWIYSVNGEYVMRGAGAVRLSPGDEVVWRYTMDSGNDLP